MSKLKALRTPGDAIPSGGHDCATFMCASDPNVHRTIPPKSKRENEIVRDAFFFPIVSAKHKHNMKNE